MANQEQLKILKQGVEVWNKWREENPDVTIDLSAAQLQGFDFSSYNLSNANLYKINLANCRLYNVKFNDSNMKGAFFRGASINFVEFKRADILGGIFVGIKDFKYVDFQEANLINSSFENTIIESGYFAWAKLNGVNFNNASLAKADFYLAIARNANFCGANLKYANLQFMDISFSDFSNACITGVNLYGTSRFEWKIRNVKCDYIFFSEKGKDWDRRVPSKREFKKSEFEMLYKHVPSIELVFEKGMDILDPALLAYIAEEFKEKHPKLGLALQQINTKGLHPSAVFEIAAESLGKEAETSILKELNEIKADRDRLMGIVTSLVTNNSLLINSNNQLSENNRVLVSTQEKLINANRELLDKIEFKPDMGISEQQFQELKQNFLEIKEGVLIGMVELYHKIDDKEVNEKTVIDYAAQHGITVLQGAGGSALFEILRQITT